MIQNMLWSVMSGKESREITKETVKSNAKWNRDSTRALMLYRNLLGFLGIWPVDTQNFMSIIRWMIAVTVEISTVIIMSLEIYRHCRGPEDSMDAFLLEASSSLSLSKLLIHRVNWKYKLELVESIAEDWWTVKKSRHRDTMVKYSHKGEVVSFMLLILAVLGSISLIVMAIPIHILIPWKKKIDTDTNNEGRLFLAAYCVFDYSTSWRYRSLLILQLMQIIVNCSSQCGNDGFFFGVTMHVCGQFDNLNEDFSRLEKNSSVQAEVDSLINRHYRLIRMAEQLEEAFSVTILAQLIISALLLCVEGLQMLIFIQKQEMFLAIKHLILILMLLMQLLLYCFAGEILEQQTQRLTNTTYECSWYDFRTTTAKSLCLVMHRAIRPHQVTAGKFVSMNFFSFKEILKASASYFSVLRIMLDR